MSHADFVHLRVHSAFSLAEGALRVPQLVELCRTREMPAVAITDTGNLFGALEFSMAAAKAGIQPIVGCQFALASEPDESRNGFRGGNRPPADDQIVLLAQSEAGYRNLLRIVSRSYVEMADDRNPVVTLAELEGETDGDRKSTRLNSSH